MTTQAPSPATLSRVVGEYADAAIELYRDAKEIAAELEPIKIILRKEAEKAGVSPFVIERANGSITVAPSGEKVSLKNPNGVSEALSKKLYLELVAMEPVVRKTAAETRAWIASLAPDEQKAVLAELVFARGEHAVTIKPKKKDVDL